MHMHDMLPLDILLQQKNKVCFRSSCLKAEEKANSDISTFLFSVYVPLMFNTERCLNSSCCFHLQAWRLLFIHLKLSRAFTPTQSASKVHHVYLFWVLNNIALTNKLLISTCISFRCPPPPINKQWMCSSILGHSPVKCLRYLSWARYWTNLADLNLWPFTKQQRKRACRSIK